MSPERLVVLFNMVLLDQYLEECKTDEEKSKKLDEISSIYNKGIIEGQRHATSAPETKTNLELINKKMDNIETHLDYIKQTLEENKTEHRELFDFIRNLMDKLDGRYARKEDVAKQEALVNKVLWTSIVSLIGFLVSIIVQLLTKFL